jgi:deoxyribodipyrimidine photo-lyase
MTAIVWFRQDLRLADNPALRAATHSARHISPVYLWSPEDEGEWAPGAASRWWLHRSLGSLAAALEAKGSRLIVRRGPAVPTLLQLAKETGATRIHWNRRHEPAAVATERKLATALQAEGVASLSFLSSLLAEPGSVKNKTGAPYQVFTPFSRALLEQLDVPPAEGSPPDLPAPAEWPASLRIDDLGLLPAIPWHESLAAHWQPGEAAARQTLRTFVETGLDVYAANRDRPDLRGSSRLSPYLHHGELSPRQVWNAVARASERNGENAGVPAAQWRNGKFIAELLWREFAAQQLTLHPTLPDRPRDVRFEKLPWRNDAPHFHAWTRGRTGYPIVDAGMRELWQTGWMHNRVRMITASFLVKNLLHRWQDGERWFWDTLVDADLANNALNWQWVTGSSPDAAPWFRIFNPDSQAEKFDPEGAYRRLHVPEAGTAGYSPPIVDLKRTRQQALDAFAGIKS